MALAEALTVLMALLPAGFASHSNSNTIAVTCNEGGPSKKKEKITTAGAVLTVECASPWEIYPPAESSQVCATAAECNTPVALTNYAPTAVAVALGEAKRGVKITFKDLPGKEDPFYLFCRQDDSAKCEVEVTIEPTTPPPGGVRPPQPPPPDSGTPSVQTCKKENGSITLKIPEKGSSAQFACGSDFVLYPKEANKVFSKDCTKEETLSDMTRTDNPPAGEATGTRSEESKTYTLTADKKPSKKTLCYLCAKQEIIGNPPGTAKDYCTIYVESDARTQLDLSFTFVLALPCVVAALPFT